MLARRIAGDPRYDAILSLAGRTRAPALPPIPLRIGGFGGIAGLVAYLREHRIDALIDATHPFAAQMSSHAAQAGGRTGIPTLRLDRPAWQPVAGDDWIGAADMADAARQLGQAPRRVFLTVGRQDLLPFLSAPWHDYLVRSVDPPDAADLPPRAQIITARGPFSEAGETALLRQHRIDIVVCKNSGGTATEAKLAASRRLRIPVVMVARPPPPPGATVPDVAAAFAWLVRQAAAPRGV